MNRTITCPVCSVQLLVKNPTNQNPLRITCPNCHKVLSIPFKEDVKGAHQQNDQETVLGCHPKSCPETQMADSSLNRQEKGKIPHAYPKKAFVRWKDNGFELNIGENIIGRKAVTSNADIQIPTSDPFASREHVVIHISRKCDGDVTASIENAKNKNTTFVNGEPLDAGEQKRLLPGSEIKMGDTIINFEVKDARL